MLVPAVLLRSAVDPLWPTERLSSQLASEARCRQPLPTGWSLGPGCRGPLPSVTPEGPVLPEDSSKRQNLLPLQSLSPPLIKAGTQGRPGPWLVDLSALGGQPPGGSTRLKLSLSFMRSGMWVKG